MTRADLFLHSLHVPFRKAPPPPRLDTLQFHYAVSQILLKASLPLEAQLQEVLRLIGEYFKLQGAELTLVSKRDGEPVSVSRWGEAMPGEPPPGPLLPGSPPPPAVLRVPLASAHLPTGHLSVCRAQPLSRADEATLQILAGQLTSHIAEQQRHRLAQQMAVTDGLTGLANHRAFQEALTLLLADARETVSLILVDIDHFKAINDNHGHLFGDRILSQVAALLAGGVREPDMVARYGGEEFAVLLPDTPLEEAMAIAERLRAMIAAEPFVADDAVVTVTVSLGVATCMPGTEVHPEVLIRQADLALYASKRRGRNRVHRYDPTLTMAETRDEAPDRIGSTWLAGSREMVVAAWSDLAFARQWPLPVEAFAGEVIGPFLNALSEHLAAGADDGGMAAEGVQLTALAGSFLAGTRTADGNPLQAVLALNLLAETVAGFVDGIALPPDAVAALQQRLARLFHRLAAELLVTALA